MMLSLLRVMEDCKIPFCKGHFGFICFHILLPVISNQTVPPYGGFVPLHPSLFVPTLLPFYPTCGGLIKVEK